MFGGFKNPPYICNLKQTNPMTNIKFSEETKERLVGKQIIEVGDDYITLDSGMRIYIIEESEIEHVNDMFSND